jgi:hypothetical protein
MSNNSIISLRSSKEKTEYYLISGTIIFSFFYFVLRSTIIDNFIWIMIFPFFCIVYKLMDNNRVRSINYNHLDKLMMIYLSYGVIITFIGLIISPNKVNIVEVFVHYYYISIIYFIVRKYTSVSMFNIVKVIKIIWVLAIILIIDIIIENYIYHNHSSAMIPWVKYELENANFSSLSAFNDSILKNIGSLLTSHKTASMMMASFFCFILPFPTRLRFKSDYSFINIKSLITNRTINVVILASILYCLFGLIVPNKTSLFSIFIVILVFLWINKSFKQILITLIFLLFTIMNFYDQIFQMIVDNFFNTYTTFYTYRITGVPVTIFNYIFDFSPLIEGYKGHNIFDYLIGKYVVSGYSGNPFPITTTELRMLSTPLFFGIFWTIIILMLAYYILKICFRLIKSKKQSYFNYLGLSFFGFFMIYFLDIHYPVFFRHGPMELFFVMLGTLSSCYMFEKQPYQELNGKDYYGFNI